MNKRQKKKAYKKIMGINPPKEVSFRGNHLRNILQWGAYRAKWETIRNLEGFNRAMAERRKQWMRRKWNHS